MSNQETFDRLSPAEQVALLYAAGNWTQKTLFQRFGVSYTEYRHARDDLTLRGFLAHDGTATTAGLRLVPTPFWVEIREGLKELVEETRRASTESDQRARALESETQTLQEKINILIEANVTHQSRLREFEPLDQLIQRFSAMQINLHWVRAVSALSLIEAAMKRKLILS